MGMLNYLFDHLIFSQYLTDKYMHLAVLTFSRARKTQPRLGSYRLIDYVGLGHHACAVNFRNQFSCL